ncbi:pro-resilin-like [Phymastichus coffea]|uniref:pro-resilin-like n=1 Tax=Phymastichus coffea TaxID=108790 RepID=UPI00273AC7CA|nr:pro-resilin-like [Phymastichus coffea]
MNAIISLSTLLLAVLALSRAEPPVSNQYLPPDQQYGPPGVQQQRPPPNQQYGAPGLQQQRPPSQQYGPPGQQQQRPPSQQYGAPQLGGGRPSGQGLFGQGNGGSLSNQYLPPNQQYGPPSVGSGAAGYPGAGAGGYSSGGAGGYPGGSGSGGYNDDANSEPAKYEFEYMVNDPPSGNDFGHKEMRDGDYTTGVYYVLLPDGRKQMVEYEADQNGYRPKITYMQVNNGIGGGAGGYPSGGPGGYSSGGAGGYPSGGLGSAGGYPGGSGQGGYRY